MKIKRISIKIYALAFILLYTLIFIASSIVAFWDIHQLEDEIRLTSYDTGKFELITAINTVVDKSRYITDKFAAWDEVYQQIENPEYYPYWKTNRLYSSNILPEYYSDVSVYDKTGKSLGLFSTSMLPAQLNINQIKPYFIIENKKPSLIMISRVIDRDHKNKTIGYIVSKSKILTPLLQVRQFNHIESESIFTPTSNKSFIKTEEFINYLSFTIKQNKEFFLVVDKLHKAITTNTLLLSVFAMLFYFLLSFFLSRPLSKISDYIDAFNNQPEFQHMPSLKVDCNILELDKVIISLSQYQKKLQAVYSNLDEKNKELWKMAHHDGLTGVLNRRAFEERWAKVDEIFLDTRCDISLILFDVNLFKSINDTYGHIVGDIVLQKISAALQKSLRKGENLYRIGGDEFACILPNLTLEKALNAAQRCRQAISEISFSKQGIKEPVRASIGIAHSNFGDPKSISDLLWKADMAVYHAKRPGQNFLVAYTDEIKKASESVLSSKVNNIVFDAIECGTGIEMFYQPIIDLNNHKVSYYEALLRIKNKGEIIMPGEVFNLIEAKKLDYEMDAAIFTQIANDFKQGKIPENTGVSINVSGPSIIHHQIIEKISVFVPYLSKYKIILEITETSLITNINHATESINKLKDLGFKIALDDFGSGYSSISYLSSMPVDIVKFDISLIRQLDDKKQLSIISHLAAMIKETGNLLVAEGIETEETDTKIKQLGFNYGQGYLYGKPAPLQSKYNV
ncbi:MAG: EAL domain-containing protein [Pseudomonadota bacterium]